MHLLDFQYEFNMDVEFIGDNETDLNLLTIQRMGIDRNGKDIPAQETYRMDTEALAELSLGLKAMLHKVDKFLAK